MSFIKSHWGKGAALVVGILAGSLIESQFFIVSKLRGTVTK